MPSSIFTNRRLTPFCSIISLPSQIPLSQLSLSEDDSVTTLIFATSSISHSLYQTKIAFRKSFSKQWFCESFSLTAIPVFQRTCFAPGNGIEPLNRATLSEQTPPSWALHPTQVCLRAGRDPYPALSGECRSFPAVILTKRTQKIRPFTARRYGSLILPLLDQPPPEQCGHDRKGGNLYDVMCQHISKQDPPQVSFPDIP